MATSKLQRYVSSQLWTHFGRYEIKENTHPNWLITQEGERLVNPGNPANVVLLVAQGKRTGWSAGERQNNFIDAAGAAGKDQKMQAKVFFQLSDEYRKAQAVETGELPGRDQEVEVVLDTLELRQDWIDLFGLPGRIGQLTKRYNAGGMYATPEVSYNDIDGHRFKLGLPDYLDTIPGEVEIKAIISKMAQEFRDGLTAVKAEVEAKKAERAKMLEEATPYLEAIETAKTYDDWRAIVIPDHLVSFRPVASSHTTVKNLKDKLYSRLNDEEHEAKAEAAKTAKTEWINQYGSERLKKAHSLGYEVGRIYAMERARHEAPEFTIDFYNNAEWKDRTNPTRRELDAMDEAAGLSLGSSYKIVWLTKEPNNSPRPDYDDCDYGYCTKPGPAIVIRGYLGKYDLVKAM